MKEGEYMIATKKKSKNLSMYPFKKGDTIGNYTVNSDDYVYHGKRYKVELICNCGAVRYKRLSHILDAKNIWCAKCRGFNKYPEKRAQRRGYFDLNIHNAWLKSVNDNLTRGNRVLESLITTTDLLNQYELQGGKCNYTGINLDVILTFKKDSNASIDRIDSSKGYTKDNIQWVYKPVNIMKNSYSEEEFLYVCNKVANFKR